MAYNNSTGGGFNVARYGGQSNWRSGNENADRRALGYDNNSNQRMTNNFQRSNQNYGTSGVVKRHTGARWVEIRSGKRKGDFCIVAWNYSRQMGLVDVFIAPYAGTKDCPSKTGRQWQNWMCTITGRQVDKHFPVMVDIAKRSAVIDGQGFSWICNTQGAKGGYCGQWRRD